MNYVICVLFFTHIKTLALTVLITGASASALYAKNLTPQERRICPSLRVCIDIIRRHDASEFDYGVLEDQFRQFGPKGRDALFNILESDDGNPDISRMITVTAPLTATERTRIAKSWSTETAAHYLPLLLDGHPNSRDMLLLTLGAEQPAVRDAARRALSQLPISAQSQPLPTSLRQPLLAALERDPIPEAAPYLAMMNADVQQDTFAALLRSGDSSIVSAAYTSLYRHNPSQAFKVLLLEMGRVTSPEQSQAIGDMLLRRHAKRPDGFYLKFADDISGDKTRAISARASGLHAVLINGGDEFPPFTPERAEALAFLVRSQPNITQDKYLPFLKRIKAERVMNYIWEISQQERWVNRDEIAAFFKGETIENKVVSDLLRSDDIRSFAAGIKLAKPVHNNAVRANTDHAIAQIAALARQKLNLAPNRASAGRCRISRFDSGDIVNQMPFFDTAWMTAKNGMRISLDRKYLMAAHPGKNGWLAGYNVKTTDSQSDGALVIYKYKPGGFDPIGNFSGPIAILPDRALKLGQITQRFWIIDKRDDKISSVSAFILDISGNTPKILHLGGLPNSAENFTVAPNGDLLMGFSDKNQAPIRLTQRGELSLACLPTRGALDVSAPN